MKPIVTMIAACAAFTAVPAHAQTPAEIAAIGEAVRYAMPHALEGLYTACEGELAPTGYLVANRDRLHAKFTEGAIDHWPGAKALLVQMADERGNKDIDMSKLPDDALRPFVDAIVVQLISGQAMKPGVCAKIERGFELLDPLPADNVAGLVHFIVELGATQRVTFKPNSNSKSKSKSD